MKSKYAILFAAISLCLFLSPVWAQPVTVRYSSDHDHAFWITNNTDKTLSIAVVKIEVLVGADWKVYSLGPNPGTLSFTGVPNILSGVASRTGWLTAHQAGYGRLQSQSIELPKDGVWRATVLVEERLTGQEAAEAYAKYQASVRANAKFPTMAFCSFWGHPLVIHSEPFQGL
jgi:hypothetical protein